MHLDPALLLSTIARLESALLTAEAENARLTDALGAALAKDTPDDA